jgi:acyl carrier protein
MGMGNAEQDLQRLTDILSRLLTLDTVAADEDIYRAGLTSIMVLPLLTELEDTFQLTIPDAEFLDARTPRDLARMIERLRADN